jgi:hypothetical protein
LHAKRGGFSQRSCPFDTFYDGDGHYWMLNPHGEWKRFNTDQIRLELAHRHQAWRGRAEVGINDLERILVHINAFNRVDAVYDVAGYSSGVYCIAPGKLILVPNGFRLIEPKAGDPSPILKILRGMFYDPVNEPWQYEAVISMWQLWYISLRDRTFLPGQAQVLVGPRNSGKTFVQEQLITMLLGGREAQPFTFLNGESRFNDDLVSAEHLKCSDEGSRDSNTRQIIANKLKSLLYNSSQRVEAKNAHPVQAMPNTKCTISCNEQPDDLRILPVSVDGIRDKMATFWVKNPGVFPPVEERAAFLEQVHAAFPAFIDYLLNFKIPKELKQHDEYQRCGVDTYRSRQVEALLTPLSPEEIFWEGALHILSHSSHELKGGMGFPTEISTPKECSATQVYDILDNRNSQLTRKLTSGVQSTSTYLGRIANKLDGRVTRRILRGNFVYTINWK